MIKVDAKTRKAAIELFNDECERLEKVARKAHDVVTDDDLVRCVRMADSAVFERYGFNIRDMFA